MSPLYYPRHSPFDDFEDVATAGHEDIEEEEEEGSKKWHQKLLKSASGVLLPRRGDASSIGGGSSGGGQDSPSQCVIAYDQRRGVEAEEDEDVFLLRDDVDDDPVCETVSLTSVSSPLTSHSLAQPNQVTLTHSLILAMTLILVMHAMIANL